MSSILDNPAVREVAVPVTVEQYHRMGDVGLISKDTELLSGVIVEKMNKSPNHSWIVQYLVDLLRAEITDGMLLRQEQPLTLAESEPEPDVAVVLGERNDFRKSHPSTAELVIEVAVSSAAIDREKSSLYAGAGVKEYLIVVPDEKVGEVYTQPGVVGFSHKRSLAEGQLDLSCFPGVSIDLTEIFG